MFNFLIENFDDFISKRNFYIQQSNIKPTHVIMDNISYAILREYSLKKNLVDNFIDNVFVKIKGITILIDNSRNTKTIRFANLLCPGKKEHLAYCPLCNCRAEFDSREIEYSDLILFGKYSGERIYQSVKFQYCCPGCKNVFYGPNPLSIKE